MNKFDGNANESDFNIMSNVAVREVEPLRSRNGYSIS